MYLGFSCCKSLAMDVGSHHLYSATNSPTIIESRPRSGTDPATCLQVFKSHWAQVLSVMTGVTNNSLAPSAASVQRSAVEAANVVIRYADQMALLLIEEDSSDTLQGPILQYMIEDDVLQVLVAWTLKQSVNGSRLKSHHLYMFEMIIMQSKQEVLVHKPIIKPMLELMASCEQHPDKSIEKQLVSVLKQLCIAVSRNSALLEALFSADMDQGAAKFLVFSLLIPYIHCEGGVGQEAREGLLLIMSLSARHHNIGHYIAQNSDFCPVSQIYVSFCNKKAD